MLLWNKQYFVIYKDVEIAISSDEESKILAVSLPESVENMRFIHKIYQDI